MPGTKSFFANATCTMDAGTGGCFIVRCSMPVDEYPAGVFEVLTDRARAHPDRLLYRESAFEGITDEVTFGQAYDTARRIGRTLLELGAGPERPVVVLAENSLRAALVILGCYAARVPVAPVSPLYSTLSSDYGKLRYVLDILTPAVVVLDNGDNHKGAMAGISWNGIKLAAIENPPVGALSWSELVHSTPAEEYREPVDPDAVAKILFTSGSTGTPKGVINTQRMMVSNQCTLAQVWPGAFAEPPQLVDWLPWNHTFGGNQYFNLPILFGGTLTIDRGRPTPAGIATMIRSIKRTKPTIYLNVPRALDLLTEHLDRDKEFAEALFENVELMAFAGAALPPPVWQRLKGIAKRVKGRTIPIVGMWGSTETAPVSTTVYFPTEEPANVGLPIPGLELKFAPDGNKYELRTRGPGVTPGYWRQPDVTAKAFDEEGFYRMGDAGRLINPKNINAGILFDGRVAENFKLLTGTWVNVGSLRVKAVATCIDLISDMVIAGHNREDVCALIFPKIDACTKEAGGEIAEREPGYLAYSPAHDIIREALRRHNASAGGGSNRVVRAILLSEPASSDAGEITDKGYINQRAVLERRSQLVDLLYSDAYCDGVIEIDAGLKQAKRA